MIRLLACLALLIGIAPALAQVQLPPGADPQNTLLIDTKYGRIVIKLRKDIAPKLSTYSFELHAKTLTYGTQTYSYFDFAKATRR